MSSFPRISVIVCTRDRPEDLTELLVTVLDQSQLPLEVIVIDDSPLHSARKVTDTYYSIFQSVGCKIKYLISDGDGLPAARNLGVKTFKGDAALFLDDDTLLDNNLISTIVDFLKDNQGAMGVQPKILPLLKEGEKSDFNNNFENAIHKVFMLSYKMKNILKVRRSGSSIFPNDLTKTIPTQRLSGCCCYRREVFNKVSFDTNLKRWGFMEDLDFSYRVYKLYPQSLYAIPYSNIIHKGSEEGRLHTKTITNMITLYWFYIFFKDIFEGSILNLMAFLWALIGNFMITMGGLIIKRKPKFEYWILIYLLISYVISFKNLKNILMKNLEFFNKNLK